MIHAIRTLLLALLAIYCFTMNIARGEDILFFDIQNSTNKSSLLFRDGREASQVPFRCGSRHGATYGSMTPTISFKIKNTGSKTLSYTASSIIVDCLLGQYPLVAVGALFDGEYFTGTRLTIAPGEVIKAYGFCNIPASALRHFEDEPGISILNNESRITCEEVALNSL